MGVVGGDGDGTHRRVGQGLLQQADFLDHAFAGFGGLFGQHQLVPQPVDFLLFNYGNYNQDDHQGAEHRRQGVVEEYFHCRHYSCVVRLEAYNGAKRSCQRLLFPLFSERLKRANMLDIG